MSLDFSWILRVLNNEALRNVCEGVIRDPCFYLAPGSVDKHHAYAGGLAVHTNEVVQFTSAASEGIIDDLHSNILLVAALWHDYAKIKDYEWDEAAGAFKKTSHYFLIRHVADSYAWFYQAASRYNLDPVLTEAIGHCILAHHGRKEWGSPVEPATAEAWILHAADMWSSQFKSKETLSDQYQQR